MNKLFFLITFFYSCFTATAQERDFYNQLSDAAIDLTRSKVTYDPTYFSIPYPNGDVPANKGVCTDVV